MQSEQCGQSDAYSLFVYAIRSQVTRDYYLRRLKIFFNYIDLLPEGTIEERCNLFATKSIGDPTWALGTAWAINHLHYFDYRKFFAFNFL